MLLRIQDYLRTAASRGRVVRNIGPFLATVTENTDLVFVNYAIPERGAAPMGEEVAALCDFYRDHGRRPRLEYIPDLCPEVEPALTAMGFAVEMRTPLMVCDGVRTPELPPEVVLSPPQKREEFRSAIQVMHAAFGQPHVPDASEVDHAMANAEAGQLCLLATVDGEAAGAGVATAPFEGVTEVAGIGVDERFRRRGIAAGLVAGLTSDAIRRGVDLAFLMAASEAEARIYARAGYRQIGEVLHISLQA